MNDKALLQNKDFKTKLEGLILQIPKQQSLFLFDQKSGVCNCWVCKTIGKEAA
jgi:hypothetical protein